MAGGQPRRPDPILGCRHGPIETEPDGERRHTQIRCLVFSADGTRMATGGGDRLVRLWDPDLGTQPRILRGHTDGVASLTFSPDGRTLATGGLAGMVRLWDLTLYQELVTLDGHTGAVACLSFAPDQYRPRQRRDFIRWYRRSLPLASPVNPPPLLAGRITTRQPDRDPQQVRTGPDHSCPD